MTREEAIKKLKSQRNVTCNGCLHAVGWCESHCKFSEAIDMAIEALKQPEPCVDVVSRQAAIDEIKNYCENGCDIAEDNWCPSCQREQFIKLLKALPTVPPEPSIPLSWVEKYIEWLKSLDNEFANLAAAHISVMVKKWRDEQDETD